MNTDWQISTPLCTCLVVVNDAGRIVYIAPLLQRTWLRRSFASLHAELMRRWGTQYRKVRLEEPVCPT